MTGPNTSPPSPQDPWLEPEPGSDALVRRYREASDADTRRPASRVRDAVRAHAEAVLAAEPITPAAPVAAAPAANQSRWKLRLLASVALAGLTSLLVLQFDREPTEDRARALGGATTTTSPSAPAMAPEKLDTTPPLSAVPSVPSLTPAPPAPSTPAKAAVQAKPSAKQAAPAKETKAASPIAMPPPMPAPEPVTNEAAAESRAAQQQQQQQKSIIAEQAVPELPEIPAAAPTPQGVTAMPVRPSALARVPSATDMSRADEGDANRHRRSGLVSTLPLASALQEAARTGRASRVAPLLARGAPLDATDPAGRTPLMLATIYNHAAVVQRLLAAGANVGLVDHDGLTALQHARQLKRERIADLIEEAS